ncbi:hypothetical protein DFP72DRAFT_1064256 [Ephemerocybe angulata]|uniref:26S proteasome regulatory subunit Rpn6 N-terminal domain-containing protein n=1 Tax=Ephemerocybe angulata TaxID=980116 RepID=A0A8H6I7J9_9AGAR|nr:hypothetical protein DFP72DRAFT_1064256 [Tulosesus angulatus]
MATTQLLEKADAALAAKNVKEAEKLYQDVLSTSSDRRNAQSHVITQSRSFMSSTAKAKTAKLIRTLLNFFY